MTTAEAPGRHRSRPPRGRNVTFAVRSVQVLAAAVSVLLLLGTGYGWYFYTALGTSVHRVAVTGLGSVPTPAASAGVQATAPPPKRSAQNLLVIGLDSRQGLSAAQQKRLHVGDATSTSTDTLMVVHIPADGAKATLISIPRDSYVDIPGHPKAKINAAYADGYYYSGAATPAQAERNALDTLIATVKNLTGLPIDHYAMVGFAGFYTIAQALHGIPVDLCRDVDDAHYSGFVMSAGHHVLDAEQALAFVRQRHNLYDAGGAALGDLGREARQRYFLAAVFDKLASAGTLLNPGRLNELVTAIGGSLTIDPGLELTDLADQMIDLTENDIVGQTIPTEGSVTLPDGESALAVDPVAVRAQIQKWINPALAVPAHGATSHPGSAPATAVVRADHGCVN